MSWLLSRTNRNPWVCLYLQSMMVFVGDLILKAATKVYKDVCYNMGHLFISNVSEFLMFAMNQEENRKKWLAAERHQLQHQIDEATKTTSKLELQYHHLTMLLKDEVRTRTCLQEERRHLVV